MKPNAIDKHFSRQNYDEHRASAHLMSNFHMGIYFSIRHKFDEKGVAIFANAFSVSAETISGTDANGPSQTELNRLLIESPCETLQGIAPSSARRTGMSKVAPPVSGTLGMAVCADAVRHTGGMSPVRNVLKSDEAFTRRNCSFCAQSNSRRNSARRVYSSSAWIRPASGCRSFWRLLLT